MPENNNEEQQQIHISDFLSHAKFGDETADKMIHTLLGYDEKNFTFAYTSDFNRMQEEISTKFSGFSLTSLVEPGKFHVTLIGDIRNDQTVVVGEGFTPALALCHALVNLKMKGF